MIERFWVWFAKFIVSHPVVLNWIINNAKKKPYFYLEGYMDRWWLTPKFLLTIDEDGNSFPYSWVPMILKVRLHHIKREDNERHMHDHPADNRSIVLKGYYDEQDVFGLSNMRYAGQTVFRRAEVIHKIAYVPAAGVWTLWFLGKKRNKWGFIVDGRKIYWRNYFGLNK